MKNLIKNVNITYISDEEGYNIWKNTNKRMKNYKIYYAKKMYASHISASKTILT